MPILKSDLPAQLLPEPRAVDVPELGGEVLIRPLTLSERLGLSQARAGTPLPDSDAARFAHIAPLLALAVVDGNGEPLMSVAQWEAFGGPHVNLALRLWDIAWEVCGMDPEAAKKKSTPQEPASP